MTLGAVLAAIAVFVPVPPGVTVKVQECPSLREASCVVGTTVYLNPNQLDSRVGARLGLAHELGHVWDQQNLDDASRAHYADLVERPGPWLLDASEYAGVGPSILPAGEVFADTYALCALGPRTRHRMVRLWGGIYGTYGEPIAHQVVANTCWWLHHPPHQQSSPTAAIH